MVVEVRAFASVYTGMPPEARSAPASTRSRKGNSPPRIRTYLVCGVFIACLSVAWAGWGLDEGWVKEGASGEHQRLFGGAVADGPEAGADVGAQEPAILAVVAGIEGGAGVHP